MPILELDGLIKVRRDSERTFTLEVPRLALAAGDRVALVGESGSGKSTLISLLALAAAPDSADRFRVRSGDGDELDVAAAWQRGAQRRLTEARARLIAYVPQRDGLMEFLTVEQNIRCAAELAGAPMDNGIDEIVTALGLQELRAAPPARLSGGQRQRAAVACALARRPQVILADEPTAALDAGNAVRVMDSLCQLARDRHAALVLATHQLHLVDDYGFTPVRARQSGANGAWHTVFAPA
ncbi:MAG: ABC transporter ATP-binding protein [Rhodobacteraceae bacterium]|nr:ABC transporter ATP-binding protein [Paracoccaceae bacterium]